MKLSKSTSYALVSAGYIAHNSVNEPVLAAQISEQYDISIAYLLRILKQLAKADVLRSKRGPRGGFALARPAKDITLLEIIEAIEGPILSSSRISEQTNKEPFTLKMEKVCNSAIDKSKEIYSKAKLSEMIK